MIYKFVIKTNLILLALVFVACGQGFVRVAPIDFRASPSADVNALYNDAIDRCTPFKVEPSLSFGSLFSQNSFGAESLFVGNAYPFGNPAQLEQIQCLAVRKLKIMKADSGCSKSSFDTNYNQYSEKYEASILAGEGGRGYCHKNIAKPNEFAKIFSPDYDVPADFISLWNEDYINHWWNLELPALLQTIAKFQVRLNALLLERNSLLRIIDSLKNGEPRWEIYARALGGLDGNYYNPSSQLHFARENVRLKQLNQEIELRSPNGSNFKEDLLHIRSLSISAARMWPKMLACYNGDAEDARSSYFTGKWNCNSNSKVSGTQIKTQLLSLIGEVKNLMTSGGLLPLEFKSTPGSEQELARKLRGLRNGSSMGSKVLHKRIAFPTVHPLIGQMLLQAVTDIIPIEQNLSHDQVIQHYKKRKDTEFMKRFLNVTGYVQGVAHGRCYPIGLWPSANMAVTSTVLTRLSEIALSNPQLRARWQIFDPQAIEIPCKHRKLPAIYYQKRRAISLATRDIYLNYLSKTTTQK